MRLKNLTFVRLALLSIFVALIAAFVATQYGFVRDTVRFICIHCIGLSG
jgi:hypothetical protein